MTQQSVSPKAPITATGTIATSSVPVASGTNTTTSVPAASLPGTTSGTTDFNKTVATKSSLPTGNAISNKPVAVKSASKPQKPYRHASKNIVFGKTSSLPDLTESQDVSNDFLPSSQHPKSIINLPLRKA